MTFIIFCRNGQQTIVWFVRCSVAIFASSGLPFLFPIIILWSSIVGSVALLNICIGIGIRGGRESGGGGIRINISIGRSVCIVGMTNVLALDVTLTLLVSAY